MGLFSNNLPSKQDPLNFELSKDSGLITEFNSDGSISETDSKGNKKVTRFNGNTIEERLFTPDGNLSQTKTTIFEGTSIREIVD